jgi:AcrR family transcriptional regulator
MRVEKRAESTEIKPKRRFQHRARQQEDKDQLRQKFIDIARAEFAAHDVEEVSLRRIAGIAGYSQGTLYQYFPSRIALLIAVKEDGFRVIVDRMLAIAAETRDPRQRLTLMLDTYVAYWLEHPDTFKSLFSMSGTIEDRRMPDGTLFGESPVPVRALQVFIDALKALFEHHGAVATPALLHLLTGSLLAAAHGAVALPLGTPSMKWPPVLPMGRALIEAVLHSWETKLEEAKLLPGWPKVNRSLFV